MIDGKVLTKARQGVLVEAESEQHWCRIPGKGLKGFPMPVPGDIVRYSPPTGTKDGWIREVHPRKTLLRRYVFGRIKEIAANLEQVIIIATLHEPPVSHRLVDRILVGASEGGLHPVVVVNKIDLADEEDVLAWIDPWKLAGYQVEVISAREGQNLDAVEEKMRGRSSLLFGQSGVGKSTILNQLISDLDLDTSALSTASGRGVHTTTATMLYPFPGVGIVADTPGIREFFPSIEKDDLKHHFPEFKEHSLECYFDDCLHMDDEGCAVRDAVEEGSLSRRRYESYKALYESISLGPKRGRQNTV